MASRLGNERDSKAFWGDPILLTELGIIPVKPVHSKNHSHGGFVDDDD